MLAALSVPVVVVVMASIFTASQSRSQQQAEKDRAEAQQYLEEQRAQAQQDAEEQRAQDQALQAYFEEMGNLLLDEDLRTSQEDDEASNDEASPLARARTLTILGRVDPERKRSVVFFLYEANLIQTEQPIVSLASADLSHVDLSGTNYLNDINLRYANLSGADLSGNQLIDANLIEANLREADLSDDNLSNADLSMVRLNNADLTDADLEEAELNSANLREAELSGADLSGADLSNAYLNHARSVTDEQLAQPHSLEGATMPDGSKHD